MKEKFCPRCGKDTEKTIEGLCLECFKERKGFVELPENIEIIRCKNCDRFRGRGDWKKNKPEDEIKGRIESLIEVKGRLEDLAISFERRGVDEWGVKVDVEGSLDEEGWHDERGTRVEIKNKTCKRCSRASGGYYEAVLQIRGDEDGVEEALDISEEVLVNESDEMGFVSDVKKVKNGYDIYLGSGSTAKRIVREISSRLPAKRKDSKTLAGERDGQKIYRSTYLVRIGG